MTSVGCDARYSASEAGARDPRRSRETARYRTAGLHQAARRTAPSPSARAATTPSTRTPRAEPVRVRIVHVYEGGTSGGPSIARITGRPADTGERSRRG